MAGFNVKDVAGLGEVVGHVKDFLLKIIDTISAREERKLRNESLRLENTMKFLEMAEKYNLTPERLKYYETFADGPYPKHARTEAGLINAPENSSVNKAFDTNLGKAQSPSDL